MDINSITSGISLNNDISRTSQLENIQGSEIPVLKNENIDKDMSDKSKKDKSEKDIKSAVNKLNKFLQGENTHIEYERHKVFKNQFTIKIVDNKTKEVIKEVPPKKILDMVAEICKLAGVIVDKKA
ncbi:hypothetical protein Z969_00210 [Clostridium novyi A str. 4570]|uniref:Uncharacterized protein n=1 Tax=Clostridium novyi A str. 4570 TaxID=1444290 RepID=A0AA88ZQI0_CLONO|nr:flagellar protein FlaG [Clostridium novyi]KGN03429.1 hypothetical protein Z969_00210 [Clostridium novyi A str. 4570]